MNNEELEIKFKIIELCTTASKNINLTKCIQVLYISNYKNLMRKKTA